jgi:hypothetical protein
MERKVTPEEVAEKVFELTEQFNQYVFEHPDILDHIPDKAALVFLDADDPDFNEANLALANTTTKPADAQHVYIKMQKHIRIVEQVDWEAKILLTPQEA